MTDLVKSGDKRMTVKEVAEALNLSECVIQKHAADLGLTENGKQTFLNESAVTYIKNKVQKSGRTDLANVCELENVDTELEMMILDQRVSEWKSRRIAELSKQVDQQKMQISEMKPKVDFFDAVTGSSDTIEIGEAAKVLAIKGLGRNNLFELLRQKGVLMQNNQPYQKYIDCGYFRTIESTFTKPDGSTHINIKTVVYQKGLDFIRKQVQGY